MKPSNKGTKRARVYTGETKTKGTARGLIQPTKNHAPNFKAVLPGQMDKLVEQGLFRRVDNPYGNGYPYYEITPKGLKYLRNLESN